MERLGDSDVITRDADPDDSGVSDGPGIVAAMLSGGDSRIMVDPLSGTNKYQCPPRPAPEIACFSSCTASPIARSSLERATRAFHAITGAASPRLRQQRLVEHGRDIQHRLLRHFDAAGLALPILCPSGTDALLAASRLLAAEHPGGAITAILPAAAETGTGVRLAAACRLFDGPDAGTPLAEGMIGTIEIPIRSATGRPRAEDELNEAFSAAAASVSGRPVLYLTHGTKTGLIAPTTPPDGTDVIVDACQARIAPARVAAYLRRGWPVILTGSKFFGGPAFSGVVLFPRDRLRRSTHLASPVPALGTVLRWTAALDVIEAFASRAAGMAAFMHDWRAALQRGFAAMPSLVPIDGFAARGPHWSDLPGIFTFAVRDPLNLSRLLTAAELQPVYRRLARAGILLGQPVSLGEIGGLRIAAGARDLLDNQGEARLSAMFETLDFLIGS